MKLFLLILLLVFGTASRAQEFIPLWPLGVRANSNGQKVTDSLFNERVWRVGTPGLYAFRVASAENKGTAVLICPGGGFERLSHLYNGFNFARWFNTKGINAYVLLYRLPHQPDLLVRADGPLTDAQRAMQLLRLNAAAWGHAPDRVGVMGVSAGGHVAASLAIRSDLAAALGQASDSVPFSPDFSILLSPVITMGTFAHQGSRRQLLGNAPSQEMTEKYSLEKQVRPALAPFFLVHAQNDSSVHLRNSLLFYQALVETNNRASLHVFPQGGHSIKLTDNPGSTALWLDLLALWLSETGFAPQKQ